MSLFLKLLGVWESLFQVSCQLGIIRVFGIVFSNWIEYRTGQCTWVLKSHVEDTAINIYKTVLTSEVWLRIADDFNEVFKMSNCIWSRHWKYCLIKCPLNAAFWNFNYESFHSENLLGVAHASSCFTLIDVGTRRDNDGSVFSNSSFGKVFSSVDLNVPPIRNIPGTSISIPLYFVGDEAFPLKPRKYSKYN